MSITLPRNEALEIASDLIYREADHLDRWRWDDWLALYTDDCEFWCPSWLSEEKLADDPDKYVSFFYLTGRAGLADRVDRIRAGLTPFATPVPRTCHVISNLRTTEVGEGLITVSSHWQANTYHRRVTASLFGYYDHELVEQNGDWKIAKKTIVLVNDHLDLPIDINQV